MGRQIRQQSGADGTQGLVSNRGGCRGPGTGSRQGSFPDKRSIPSLRIGHQQYIRYLITEGQRKPRRKVRHGGQVRYGGQAGVGCGVLRRGKQQGGTRSRTNSRPQTQVPRFPFLLPFVYDPRRRDTPSSSGSSSPSSSLVKRCPLFLLGGTSSTPTPLPLHPSLPPSASPVANLQQSAYNRFQWTRSGGGSYGHGR